MANSPEKKKRKRETEGVISSEVPARITYHTPFKTFERLFNEESLDDTKRVVRAKLGLEPNVDLELSQIRGQSRIVLEDEDDFRAFRVALKESSQVEVQVAIAGSPQAQTAEITAPAKKKRRTKQSDDPDPSSAAAGAYATPANTTANHSTAFSVSSLSSYQGGQPPPDSSTSIASSSKSISPATPLNALPFPLGVTPVPVRVLPPATGVFSAMGGGGENGKEKDAGKEKEKPKRVRKKSEAASAAQAALMSPAAREKAAAILERHRQAVAERAKPRKREKYGIGGKEPEAAPPAIVKLAEETPPVEDHEGADSDVHEQEEKPKKEKRRKKKKGVVDTEHEENEPESRSPEKKDKKRKKDKTKEVVESAHMTSAVVDEKIQPVPVRNKSPIAEDRSKDEEERAGKMVDADADADADVSKSKPKPRTNGKLVPVITRHKDASAKKEEKAGAANSSIPATKVEVTTITTAPTVHPGEKSQSIASPIETSVPNASAARTFHPIPLCPICLESFHLRFKCPLLQERGPALEKRLEELRTGIGPNMWKGKGTGKGKGKEPPNPGLVKDIEQWLETERKREVLRSTRPAGAKRKRKATPESEDLGEEEEAASNTHMDPENPDEEEENDDDDDNDDVDSVPESLSMPTNSKNSLVSVQKPGEGSETTSSEDEEDQPVAEAQNESEDEDMPDASREATPQAHVANPNATRNLKESEESSSTNGSTSSDDSSSPAQRPEVRSQKENSRRDNKPNKPASTIRSSRNFRGINGEPSDGADDSTYEHLERKTAYVLVRNSDDSDDEEMMDDDVHTPDAGLSHDHVPMDEEKFDAMFLHRGSPVAKGRAPGTPSRIQVMKDRYGNTAPVLRTHDGVSAEGPSSSPGPRPFPDHKFQSMSQPTAASGRLAFLPRLSGLANMFKGAPMPTSSPRVATPISVPGASKANPGVATRGISEESSSSSSPDSDTEDGKATSRIPMMQRAGSSLVMPPRKSVLSQL